METVIGMTIENPDLPFALPSVKFMTSTCITQKDAVPNIAQKNQKCETTDYKVIGSTVSWTSRCVDKNSTTEGSGSISEDKTCRGSMHAARTSSDPMMAVNGLYPERELRRGVRTITPEESQVFPIVYLVRIHVKVRNASEVSTVRLALTGNSPHDTSPRKLQLEFTIRSIIKNTLKRKLVALTSSDIQEMI